MHGLERYTIAREKALRVINAICPDVVGNPFIPHWPYPKQMQVLGAHLRAEPNPKRPVFEALYGGAAGGGKSDVLLMGAAQLAWKNPNFAAIMFRRTYQDLQQPDALIPRAMEWWIPQGVHWNGSSMKFTFPNGSIVQMGYINHPKHRLNYQGARYHNTFWDELSQHEDDGNYRYVALSRCRRGSDESEMRIPLRALSSANPGGPGHTWVKKRFVGSIDIATGEHSPGMHPYFPANLNDNPYLDRDSYEANLQALHPTEREQLLNGDWDARDPGDYFRRDWFGPLLDPEEDMWPKSDKISVRWWDLAASEKEDACRTAGVKMSRHRCGVRAVEHAIAFRATPGRRDAKIIQTAQADGYSTYVGIEIEPGSGGPAQFYNLEKQLRAKGYKVVGARPKVELTDKEAQYLVRGSNNELAKQLRAGAVASCLERGHKRRGEGEDGGEPWFGDDAHLPQEHHSDGLRLFADRWTQSYLDELEGFPDVALMDLVDATSGAWWWLEAHPFGSRVAPTDREPDAPVELQNIHPDDRPEDPDGSERNGLWLP